MLATCPTRPAVMACSSAKPCSVYPCRQPRSPASASESERSPISLAARLPRRRECATCCRRTPAHTDLTVKSWFSSACRNMSRGSWLRWGQSSSPAPARPIFGIRSAGLPQRRCRVFRICSAALAEAPSALDVTTVRWDRVSVLAPAQGSGFCARSTYPRVAQSPVHYTHVSSVMAVTIRRVLLPELLAATNWQAVPADVTAGGPASGAACRGS